MDKNSEFDPKDTDYRHPDQRKALVERMRLINDAVRPGISANQSLDILIATTLLLSKATANLWVLSGNLQQAAMKEPQLKAMCLQMQGALNMAVNVCNFVSEMVPPQIDSVITEAVKESAKDGGVVLELKGGKVETIRQ